MGFIVTSDGIKNDQCYCYCSPVPLCEHDHKSQQRVDTLALWVMLGTGALLARLATRSESFSGSPLGVWGQNPACVLAVVQGWDSSFPVR